LTSVGIISDTHGFLDPSVHSHFAHCDELWHAGDWGSGVAGMLHSFKKVRGVSGNIDGPSILNQFPEELFFHCEEVSVFIIHIGGYPPRYETGVRQKLERLRPDLFICGHSHILKIIRDPQLSNMLCINPGAAGKSGFHQVKTVVRLKIEGKRIFDVEVIELGKRAT
jgi:hypothetical protein